MQTYRDLIVWQKSIDLVVLIYNLTRTFPVEERFNLTSQMCRASVSIPSNIAEGYARRHRKENHQFINIAFASAIELQTQLIITERLNLGDATNREKSEKLLDEILKMLYRYRESLTN